MSNPSTADNAIDLLHVEKIYRRRVHALRGISMQVRRGEIFGLLGPNGAGKSTLVKIMMHVVRATRAAGTILDFPIGHTATLGRIGYLPENHRFPRYLSGRQAMDFFSALAKVDRTTRRKRGVELLEMVGLTAWADTKISQYSKGMLQRLGLAAALGADPELLVLDEPTDGVDPAGRRDIRQVLLQLRERGKTVFINSHLLSELETVCDRVAILVQGAVARQGTIDELTAAKQCFLFEFAPQPDPWRGVWYALPGAFSQAPEPGRPATGFLADKTWVQFDGICLRVGKTEPAEVQGILDELRKQGLVIRRMHVMRPSLEELFFEAVGPRRAGTVDGGTL
ncbi:MAG: ABC transporter ATP-binding protein [Tepidisphaeraceae bacterium]